MNNIITKIENREGINVVSSRVISEQLGKEHKHILEQIDKILRGSQNFGKPIETLFIKSSYIHLQNKQEYREYLLTKDGFILYMFNIQGFNEFKMSYINRFNEMEKYILEKTKLESLEELVANKKENQKLIGRVEEIENKLNKAEGYIYDILTSSEGTMKITEIAEAYGLSGIALNRILKQEKIIRKINGRWVVRAKYSKKGYTDSTSVIVNGKVYINQVWTQKGRKKIHEVLTELGYTTIVSARG